MKKKIFYFLFFSIFFTTFPFANIRKTLIKKGMKAINAEKKEKDSSKELSFHELTVDLKNPIFVEGVLKTQEGGVIKNKDIRIQAKKMKYIKKTENGKFIHKIEASEDLMMIYKNRVFIGDELEYDFIKKNGIILNGKTYAPPWYIGGEKIELQKDGSYEVDDVFITTCENKDSSWDIHAKKAKVSKKNLLRARKVRFRLFKFPFWLPSFKINLKKFLKKPIVKYKINWDKKVGPKGSIRYQAYSWEEFALFLRLDYRWNTGFGGAVETEYFPSHKRSSFVTRSYLAEDVIEKDLTKKRRYRLQGHYRAKSVDNKTYANLTWDKFSDIRMPSDFKSDDFDIDTAKKTEFILRHEKKNLITLAHARARANDFETIKQDIPTIYANIHPISFSKDFIFSSFFKFSYLDIQYSDDISPSLPEINSFRGNSYLEILKLLDFKIVTITPKVAFTNILYNDSPSSNFKSLSCFQYDAVLKTKIYRYFSRHKHTIEPYVKFIGITQPTTKIDSNYIFSIEDGYNKLTFLKIGLLNQVFSLKKSKLTFDLDMYSNYFINEKKNNNFQKFYLDFNFNLPSIFFSSKNGWHLNKNLLDYSNNRISYTVNKNIAFALEFRYRSKYDWRKAQKDNFILDVSRDESILLDSPLSDQRKTFLSHFFLRLNPFVTFHIETHHGKRVKEPWYSEYKIDLYTMVSSNWKIRISYQKTQTDKKFTFDYFLMKF